MNQRISARLYKYIMWPSYYFVSLYDLRSIALCIKNFFGSTQRILSVQYSIPDCVQISTECRDLISRIFVFDPATVSGFLFPKSWSSFFCKYIDISCSMQQLEKCGYLFFHTLQPGNL